MTSSVLIVISVSVLPTFGQTILAQNVPPTDVKQYLTAKYNLPADDVFSNIRQTSGGLRGYLNIKGRIVPNNYVPASENIQDRARAVAQLFIKEESTVLGIPNMDELREILVYKSEGEHINIKYFRYIDNWEVWGAYIKLEIAPDGTIIATEAYLVPTPPELYQAVSAKTLTEAEIRKLVEDDMQADARSPETAPIMKEMISSFDTKLMRPRQFAIPEPPYAIWEVQTAWAYTIDALTGKILKKSPIVREGHTIHQWSK
jgi:hypothetical protein